LETAPSIYPAVQFLGGKFIEDLLHQSTGPSAFDAYDPRRLINERPALGLVKRDRVNHIEFSRRLERR
jgi:hypothetical protein